MPGTLPPTLPTAGSPMGNMSAGKLGVGPIGRAQNLNTTELSQHKERSAATTSIGRAMSKSASTGPSTSVMHPGGMGQPASTSVAHPGGGGQQATTSIFKPQSPAVNAGMGTDPTGMTQEDRDNARFDHAQRKMLHRKAKERAAAARTGKKEAGLQVKTGAAFKRDGAGGFRKRLGAFFKNNRASYKNISAKDRAFFEKLISERAGSKTTGSQFTRMDKRKMRSEVTKAMRSGKITREDMRDFNKLIGGL